MARAQRRWIWQPESGGCSGFRVGTPFWNARGTPLRSGRKATLLNQYTGITDCYDLLMRGGYYDHDTMAGAADAVMGDRKSVV